MILDNIINVVLQIVSCILNYLGVRIFSKLFNGVFILSYLLAVLFFV